MNIPEAETPSLAETIAIIEALRSLDLESIEIDDLIASLRRAFTACSADAFTVKTGFALYRATTITHEALPQSLSRLSYPPKECVRRPERCNRPGCPLFYCCTGAHTTLWEIRAKVGDNVVISKWRTRPGMPILNVGYDAAVVFEALGSRRKFPLFKPEFSNVQDGNERNDRNNALLRFFSELFMQVVPFGEEFKYKISICLAELFMADDRLAGLMYPSIAMYADADNVVLKPEFVDSHLIFDSAYYFAVTAVEPMKVDTNCFAVCVGADHGGHLRWIGPGRFWELSSSTATYLL